MYSRSKNLFSFSSIKARKNICILVDHALFNVWKSIFVEAIFVNLFDILPKKIYR
jgi:hypothetical protein